MDLSELQANHRRALLNAGSAQSMTDKRTYFDLVGYYAKRIRDCRARLGIPRHSWQDLPPSLRCRDE